MSGTASVTTTFAAATTATGAQLDGNFNTIVAYLNDPTNRNNYAADTGTANTYVISLSPAPSSYTAGLEITFRAASANTGASVLNVNGMGQKNLVYDDGTALEAGEIQNGAVVKAVYDSASFQLVGTPIPKNHSLLAFGGATVAAGNTYYGGGPTNFQTADSNLGRITVPFKCVAKNLFAKCTTAPSAGQSFAFTLQKNASDTALTTSITDTNVSASNTTSSVSLAAGDDYQMKLVTSGSAAGSDVFCSVDLQMVP